MKTVTVDDVMGWYPCKGYPREQVEALFAGRSRIYARTVARLGISGEDRLWVLTRMAPLPVLLAWGRWCTLQVIHLWDAPEIVVRFLETGDENIRVAARGSALTASSKIAGGYALSATWSASWDTAKDARDASWDAARGAAMAASGDAWDTARESQAARLAKMIEEGET